MGREIRRVPADWQHPKVVRLDWKTGREVASYEPLVDKTLAEAQAEWDAALEAWPTSEEATKTWGEDKTWDDGTSVKADDLLYPSFEDYHGERPAELYAEDAENVGEQFRGTRQPYRSRSWTPEEATHFQVYETVSEGTPVSPVLDSLEAVVEWAVSEGYSREAAVGFANSGWAPSMMLSGGVLRENIEAMGGAA